MIRPGIKRNKRPLDDEWMDDLIEVVVDREVNVPGRADLRFFDSDLAHFAEVSIGDAIVVSATEETGATSVVFTGEIVVIEVEQVRPGADRELLLTAFDTSHRLAHAQEVRPQLKKSLPDVVNGLISTAGATKGTIDVPRVEIAYHPGRHTALQVLERLCAQYGLEWWVDAKGELSVGSEPKPPSASPGTVEYGYLTELTQLSVRVAGFAPGDVKVPFWDRAAQEGRQEGAKVARPSDSLAKKAGTPPWRKPYVVVDHEGAADRSEAQSSASGYERRRLAETVVASGRIGFCDHRLELGTKMKIKESGDLVGPYTVTSLRHLFSGGESHSEFATGRVRPTSLVGLSAPDPTPAPPLAVGTVTKVLAKAESGPDLGPVAVVKYGQLDGSYETNEARLLAIGGSSEHGFFAAPTVGDEVLVGYERGDLRYPVVLGGLHSANHPAGPIAADSKTIDTVRLSDGKATKGNALVFTLDKDKGTVKLHRTGGIDAVLMDQDRVKVTAEKELVLEVGQSSITMKKDGTIQIKGKDVTVTASGNVKSESKMNTEIAAMKATVKAQGQLALEGGPQAELKSSGQTVVKGSIVQIN